MTRRSIFVSFVCAVALIATSIPAHAGTALVKNIDGQATSGSSPRSLTKFGSKVFFSANDGTHGRELWRTNGKRKKTKLVADLNPVENNPDDNNSSPQDLAVLGNLLLFRAFVPGIGFELFSSDGTAAGTQLVKDINPGNGDSLPIFSLNDDTTEIVVAGDLAYFAAEDGDGDTELWKSDGTGEGTEPVGEINPTGDALPNQLTAVGSTLFFRATDGVTGLELYRYQDGDAAPTLVEDIRPDGQSIPSELTALADEVFFQANNGTNGKELWVADTDGAALVQDLNTANGGTANSNPTGLTVFAGHVYFRALGPAGPLPVADSLWRSDGATIERIRTFKPSGTDAGAALFTVVGDRLFFTADDESTGAELWVSNGIPAGQTGASTNVVTDVSDSDDALDPDFTEFVSFAGRLYFGSGSLEGLWRSDGTAAGTRMVKGDMSFPHHFEVLGSKLLFNAGTDASGEELYKHTT